MPEKYTLNEALDVLMDLEQNVASLLGVANVDVADEYGDDAAEPRGRFLSTQESGGDKTTTYARRLARMLVERLVVDYDIVTHVRPVSVTPECHCTPAIANLSDGPSFDCPVHGIDSEPTV